MAPKGKKREDEKPKAPPRCEDIDCDDREDCKGCPAYPGLKRGQRA